MEQPSDTLALLKECSSGIETGVSSIKDALEYAHSQELRDLLNAYKVEHEHLRDEVQACIKECAGDDPEAQEKHTFSAAMGRVMSKMKINAELAFNDKDTKVASLMSEGCEMGSRTLTGYVNQYKNADKKAKNLAGNIIRIEDELCDKLRKFL